MPAECSADRSPATAGRSYLDPRRCAFPKWLLSVLLLGQGGLMQSFGPFAVAFPLVSGTAPCVLTLPLCVRTRAPMAGRRGGRVDEEREVQYHISYKDLDYFKKHFLIFLFKFCVRNHSGLNIRQTKISCAIGAGGSLQVAGKSGAVESSFSFGSTMALCGTFQLLSYTDVKANYCHGRKEPECNYCRISSSAANLVIFNLLKFSFTKTNQYLEKS